MALLDNNKDRILIAPAPNWFCITALSLEESKGIYVYTTKNSLILATILENQILGSVYCGVKSKPIGVSIFTSSTSTSTPTSTSNPSSTSTLSEEEILIVSTHLDHKIRLWKVIHENNRENIKGGVSNISSNELRIILLSDSINSKSPANLVYYFNHQIFIGDIQGEILKLSICDFKSKNKPEHLIHKFHPLKEEITTISKMLDFEKIALGYKNGQIIIINHLNGNILLLLEDEIILKEASIQSIIDFGPELIITTSKGNSCLFRYCQKSQEIKKIKINDLKQYSINNQGLEENSQIKKKFKLKNQKSQQLSWTILVSNNQQFYLIIDHEIFQLIKHENNEIYINKNFTISIHEREKSKELINSEIIFSIIKYEFNENFYLLGITKSKKVFLFNTTKWKLEWIMNTLGGWIDQLLSPNGFSHIIYLLTGEGKLMGLDMLQNQKEFSQRAFTNYIYHHLTAFNKDEKILKVSINPIHSEFILYLTNLGNLGILYINPDNISQYSNIQIKLEKYQYVNFLLNSDFDWIVLLKPPISIPQDHPNSNHHLQEILNSKSIHSSNMKLFNSQFKSFNSLLFNVNKYSLIFLYNHEENQCLYSNLITEFENGEFILKMVPTTFEIFVNPENKIKEYDQIIQLKLSNQQLTMNYSNSIYFLVMNSEILIQNSNNNYFEKIYNHQLTMENELKKNNQETISINIYKLIFSSSECENQTIIESIDRIHIKNALIEAKNQTTKFNLEKVITGFTLLNSLNDYQEIYILVTNYGNLIIINSNKSAIKFNNIFKEKNKMNYNYFDSSIIQVGNQFNNLQDSAFIFNLAISNEFNQTSIIQIKVENSNVLNKNDINVKILLIRSNTNHKSSLTNKFHFKCKSIWYRDVKDFDNEFENNLRLLIGGQEQILHLLNISSDITNQYKNKVINKNSLLFLTNKSIYQQSNQSCLKSLELLLKLKLKNQLNINKNGNDLNYLQSELFQELKDDDERILDLTLFLNHKNSSLDLIKFHLETLNSNLSLYIEYLYLINYDQIDFNSKFFKNLIERYPNDYDNKEFIDYIKIFENIPDDYLLHLWLIYISKVNLDYSLDSIIRCILIIRLDKLYLKLKFYKNCDNNLENNSKLLLGENPNIIHEYCILNILLGRCHKSIEMYCYFNLFQCAWLISNLYFGNEDKTTIKILKDWSNYLSSNNLLMQSYKCLIACSDFETLYKTLLGRINENISSLNNELSFSQLNKLFYNFKLTGYNLIISCLKDKKSNLISKFSLDIINYILLVLNKCGNNNSNINLNEVISIVNEEFCLVDETINEIEMKIMKSIYLYELIIKFSLLLLNNGNKIQVLEIERFLKRNKILNKEDLFLIIKKVEYLPFEELIELRLEFDLMKNLLIFTLIYIFKGDINSCKPKLMNMIKTLFNLLFKLDSSFDRENIFEMTFQVLLNIFIIDEDLSNFKDLSNKLNELSKISLEWNSLEFLIDYRDLDEDDIILIKYDLYILSIIKRINNENISSKWSKYLNKSDIKNLSLLITITNNEQHDEGCYYFIKDSISYNFLFNNKNKNQNLIWLYNKLMNWSNKQIEPELSIKARKLAIFIKKQYLNSKDNQN